MPRSVLGVLGHTALSALSARSEPPACKTGDAPLLGRSQAHTGLTTTFSGLREIQFVPRVLDLFLLPHILGVIAFLARLWDPTGQMSP